MKKSLIAAFVGGVIIFIWQSLSNTVLDLHRPAVEYTAKQDTILNFLNGQFTESGRYFLPTLPKDATTEAYEQLSASNQGKPWAIVSYHKAMDYNMAKSLVITFITDFIVVWLLCWILLAIPSRTMPGIILVCLAIGLLVFLNSFFTTYTWYQDPGLGADLIDALVSWGLCGLWLGWWLKNNTVTRA